MIGRRLFSSHSPFAHDSSTRTRALAVTLGLGLVMAACSPAGPRDYEGHGKAVEVDLAARTVTLDHEEIEGLMKGMTMTFAVAPGVELDSIAAGSEVEFVLRDADNALTVTRIRMTMEP